VLEVQGVMQVGAPTMGAGIGIIRALNARVQLVFNRGEKISMVGRGGRTR